MILHAGTPKVPPSHGFSKAVPPFTKPVPARSETCRQHMLQELLHLADRCDGMRVDMAMLCVNDVVERT